MLSLALLFTEFLATQRFPFLLLDLVGIHESVELESLELELSLLSEDSDSDGCS